METPNPLKKETVFRLATIEVEQSQTDEKILGMFRFESSGPTKRGPILLVFTEINGTGYVYDQLIDVVNTEAEQSRTLTVGVDADPVTRFEKIVQNVNQSVAKFVSEEPTPINWTRVNIFIVELSNHHLCLAGVGRLMNMFLQKQEDASFKTFDLFGSLDQSPDVNPEKLFASIICGDMHPGDVLIAGSQNLERLRNELRMKERLATLPPVTAALEIRQDLERQAIPDDFVATVVSCAFADAVAEEPVVQPAPGNKSTASVDKLRDTEANTLRRLAPIFGGRTDDVQKGEPAAPFIDGARGIFTRITRLFHRAKASDVAAMASMRGMHAGFGTLFTKKRKSLLIGAVVLLVLIVVIGSVVKFQRNAAAERAAWNATFDQARALVERAEGESVYSEDRARKTLAEADDIAASLANTTDGQQEALAGLKQQGEGLREKLRRIVNVDQPTELYALPDGLPDGTLTSPIFFKGSLVAADTSSNALIVINPETKEATRATLAIADGKKIVTIAPGNSSIIVALDDGSLLAASITGTITPLTLGDGDAEAFTDLALYTSRLYRLDAAKGQIWRYPSSSGGFGAEQAYLQAASTDLNDAAAIGIDANVYVLKKNGTIVRFFSGGQDGFNLTAIDPPLTNGNDLWTDDDAESQYLAVADAAGKRVLLFTKEGRLAAQYTSPTFAGPTGVVADEATKKLYVIDGNSVIEVPLP